MATPRYKLVDDQHACSYHLASRCVRRAWLCGYDSHTGQDYSYRKDWLVDRLTLLARCFAVEIYGYAVMSNHFHVVLHYDPKACESWTAEEVAERWVDAFPPTERGAVVEERKAEARALLLDDPEQLEHARRTLGSLSAFMKHLKQPIARRANLEDGCEGHFFEQRFYSGALLSEDAMLAAMAYVDLNPVRAGLTRRLAECRDASIGARLRENSAEGLANYLGPIVSGLGDREDRPAPLNLTLADYITILEGIIDADTSPSDKPNRIARWRARVSSLRKRQRAYGSIELLRQWTANRGMQLREGALPN